MSPFRSVASMGMALLCLGCSSPPTPPVSQAAAPAPAVAESGLPPSFVDTVWKVTASDSVPPGTLYVFLSEGTLVVASSTGTPSLGKWTQQDGKLTMIEEGLAYPTDVLELTANTFRIRSHNPGEPVEIAMTLAR